LYWNGADGRCQAAVVLAPHRAVEPGLLLDLGLLALFDALAVLAPPQMPLAVQRPDGITVDGARAATVRAVEGDGADWAVLGFDVAIRSGHAAPGEMPDHTCLVEEGFGDIAPAELLEHWCRHLLGWVDAWLDDGAGPLSRAVDQRAAQGRGAARLEAA
jgi:BirA family biotin operon repressor/biotin-[acetyl-CoA-carboxylase] ligase